jgi:hypothetical protein
MLLLIDRRSGFQPRNASVLAYSSLLVLVPVPGTGTYYGSLPLIGLGTRLKQLNITVVDPIQNDVLQDPIPNH